MLKKIFVLLVLLTVTGGDAQAESVAQASAEVVQAYAYATAGSQKNGAVFMTVKTNPLFAEKLVEAQSDVAERVELHTHLMEGDHMKMRQVEAIEAGEDGVVTLKPHGDHIMLMGLKAPLEKGGVFPLILTFEHAGRVEASVHVVAPGTTPDDTEQGSGVHEGHSMHMHETKMKGHE